MNSVIYSPLKEYEQRLKTLHEEKTAAFLNDLVQRSGVNIEENRETVRQYHEYKENLAALTRKLNWRRFFRVLMCITVVLIPVVILKATPKIKALREEVAHAEQRAEELLALANRQMLPLNTLLGDRDALRIIEQTVPLISFADSFTVEQETDMKINYDFGGYEDNEQSTLDVLAGSYNENPFLFENRLIHTMGQETYHGYLTIHWTETYRDSDGKLKTRSRSETLHATVTKPKPFYHTQVVLNYCSQGAPELEFTRDATHLEQKSDKAIERYVRRGEKKLKRKTDKAIRQSGDFMAMSNSDFEVLFDALDRTNEVQFRSLFTPLAQTNMVELIRSRTGFGDDFNFFKMKRTNRILTNHSQGRAINLLAGEHISYSYDIIEESFKTKNAEFFKAVYFDFAPLLAIPAYQERPVHSLKPIPDLSQRYSLRESEALANAADRRYMVHPNTKTQAILKSSFVGAKEDGDETCITAYSYDIEKRVDYVSVHGGDGKFHSVPVEWDNYLPLVARNHFCVAADKEMKRSSAMARRGNLCIFNI